MVVMPAPPCKPGCGCGKHFRTAQHNARIGWSVRLTAEAKKWSAVSILIGLGAAVAVVAVTAVAVDLVGSALGLWKWDGNDDDE